MLIKVPRSSNGPKGLKNSIPSKNFCLSLSAPIELCQIFSALKILELLDCTVNTATLIQTDPLEINSFELHLPLFCFT